ncbi:MAG TPA: ABC transporter ATP-binding protein [Gemmatimonadales bacterium]|jgi:putative spermidine/putrescine transport system ATP-binding protein
MSEAVVELQSVTRRFGAVAAVNDVTLEVRRGEFLSLLGPSGCGKTTTLRIIAGLETPDAGSVRLLGGDATRRPAWERPISMVFQNGALFPHLDVARNVAFGLRERRRPAGEIRERVARTLELVRLDPALYAGRRITELSGGQQQRVALARALVLEPSILLLDEPLGALDLQLRKAMQLELKELNRRLGISFVFVTHDQEEALVMSDRIAVMDQGRIAQVGTPAQIYERPRTAFVAGFIGLCNIFGPAKGAGHRIAVRPERTQLHAGAGPAGSPAGEITDVVYLGGTIQVHLRLDDGARATVQLPTGGADQAWRIGERASLSWRGADAAVLED